MADMTAHVHMDITSSIWIRNLPRYLEQPLRISSALSSAGSLLLLLISLSTSYWVTESTSKGLVHGGLWETCVGPKCTQYWFNVLDHVHVTRGLLFGAAVWGLLSLSMICFSFKGGHVCSFSLAKFAAAYSFVTGIFIVIAMCIFTVAHRNTKRYIRYLVILGSSFRLGWASAFMYGITGVILILTHRSSMS